MRMARVLKLAVSSLFVLPGLMLAPVTGWAELDYHALLAPPNAAWAKQDPLVPSDEWVITGVVFFSFRECQTFRLQKVERLRAMLPELPRKPRMGGDRRAALAEMADLDAA